MQRWNSNGEYVFPEVDESQIASEGRGYLRVRRLLAILDEEVARQTAVETAP